MRLSAPSEDLEFTSSLFCVLAYSSPSLSQWVRSLSCLDTQISTATKDNDASDDSEFEIDANASDADLLELKLTNKITPCERDPT